LIHQLLVPDPTKRLGHGQYENKYLPIKGHAFFAAITDWDGLPLLAPPTWQSFEPALSQKVRRATEAATCKYPDFLINNEACLLEGLIEKKRQLSKKKRWLVLTSSPRLFYINEDSREIMGEIPLATNPKITVKKDNEWRIDSAGKQWQMKSMLEGKDKTKAEGVTAAEWKEKIEQAIARRP
jgi:hypothetical protein